MTPERPARDGSIRTLVAAEEARLLTRRLRLGLLASIAVIVAFAAADAWRRPEALAALAAVKGAQVAIVVGGLLALRAAGSRSPRLVGVLIVSAIYVSAAANGIMRGDAAAASILLMAGVMASAVVLPWGAGAQIVTVAVAAAALAATVAAASGGAGLVTSARALAIAVAFGGSIAVAAEHGRQRRARTHVVALLASHTEILERISAGAPLESILTALVTMVERHADGMLCSVLLLDGDRLHHGAAPSLPAAYSTAIDGLMIGDDVGSCGTAAYRREPVIVTDIASDPLWAAFRTIALRHNLRACWSAPILARDQTCLGTLAMYYHEPRRPYLDELELIASAAHLAGVAIERHRGEQALAASREQLESESHVAQALMQAGQAMLGTLNTPVVLERLARLATDLLGCDCSDTVVRLADDDAYVTGSAHGYPANESAGLERVRMSPAMLANLFAALADRPVVQVRTDAVENADAARLLRTFGITSSMYVGLRRGDELIGFLSAAYRGRSARFDKRQSRIAIGIAQLASMALENARLVEETKRASQIKTEFVSTMSHELRTPLSVIIGYTDMLADDVAPAERAMILGKIRGSSIELLEMIEATLNVNRLEAGKDQPQFERLSLATVFEELAGEFAALPRRRQTALRWEKAPPVALYSDRRKLRIVLKNLVGNALKFTSEGEVVVECKVADGACAIVVRDTGVGIAREQLPFVFDMFRQGDSSDARSYGGVGLGLYIVRRLLTQLGGDVSVASTLGKGTTFTVTVPLADEALRARA